MDWEGMATGIPEDEKEDRVPDGMRHLQERTI